MDVHLLLSFVLLVILVPLLSALTVAWKEVKSPSIQTPTRVTERTRDDTRGRFVPMQVSPILNSLAPITKVTLFTRRTKFGLARGTPPSQIVPPPASRPRAPRSR
jgi:hypothetical protein